MGKVLQIRVSAWTYDEGEVRKKWPSLWKLVWEESGPLMRQKGVVDLAKGVYDAVRAGLIPDAQARALRPEAENLEKIRLRLEDALGAWKAREADTLTYSLEDSLDALEDTAGKF